ncbi:MAG: sulfurtransferase TusA family protein [Deltaproteobacteria bacterium]|nr:sulfurtransferase TusA family protein [Deltaproteobacteria bacterium]
MTPMLDITRDVCPMTFVKVKMGLSKMTTSEHLEVRLKEEALKNVISSLKSEGHKIVRVEKQGEIFHMVIEKSETRSSTA